MIDAFVVVVVVNDEGFDLRFQIAWQVMVLEQDSIFKV